MPSDVDVNGRQDVSSLLSMIGARGHPNARICIRTRASNIELP
jgi:hypothetical protein